MVNSSIDLFDAAIASALPSLHVDADYGVFNGAPTFITLAENARRPHDVRIELARCRIERVHCGIDAERGDVAGEHDGRVEVPEGRRRRRVGQVVRGHVDGLDRGDRAEAKGDRHAGQRGEDRQDGEGIPAASDVEHQAVDRTGVAVEGHQHHVDAFGPSHRAHGQVHERVLQAQPLSCNLSRLRIGPASPCAAYWRVRTRAWLRQPRQELAVDAAQHLVEHLLDLSRVFRLELELHRLGLVDDGMRGFDHRLEVLCERHGRSLTAVSR